MSRKASQFQKKVMSLGYRGKEVFKPLNTGWIDEHVACVREWIANIFFYTRNGTTIMIDAGYNYERLAEKMDWLEIDPATIAHVLITHQDTDHVGALERDGSHLLDAATLSHTDEVCVGFKRQKPHDPSAPYDGYDESDDTELRARTERLAAVVPVFGASNEAEKARSFWNRMAPLYDVAMGGEDGGLGEAIKYVGSFVGQYDVALDAACGTGAFACGVAPRAGFVAACDLSPKMVAQTSRKLRHRGLENVVCGTGNLCALDFSDGSFDVTIAGNVLHLLAEPQQAIAELKRVTRPSGTIVIPNYMNEEDTDRRFLKLVGAVGFTVHSEWNTHAFLEFLTSCGLKVVEHRNFEAKQPLCIAICQN